MLVECYLLVSWLALNLPYRAYYLHIYMQREHGASVVVKNCAHAYLIFAHHIMAAAARDKVYI